MLNTFLQRARQDLPVYLTDVRRAFQAEGTQPFSIHVTLYDGSAKRFPLLLPETRSEAEAEFVASYVYAAIYNILSSLGAVKIDIYLDPKDAQASALAAALDEVFQTRLPKTERTGYGKCLNVNERILRVFAAGNGQFGFRVLDIAREPEVPPAAPVHAVRGIFEKLPALTAGRMILGMDVGGTDIKLAASVDGRLRVCKEFDWFPASCPTAREIVGPMLLLTRMMRAAASLCAAGREDLLDRSALGGHATAEELLRGTEAMERAAGGALKNFDAIGLCFPDVVIRNRIVGGETHKTHGMRENKALDYEAQFAQITDLNDELAAYVAEGGVVMNTNDGPMAAFTAAVEQAAKGGDVSQGFFAHTLGTELGAGWIRPDGSIPEIPLEVYNFVIDLGSFAQRRYDAGDARSVNNLNTGLPGTLQKYTSQSGVFRLAAKYLPQQAPALFQEALDKGLFAWEGERLVVPTSPQDMRKPCLEFFMGRAAEGGPCAGIFREIGEYMAVTWQETDYILEPEAKTRTLFGRMVKDPACFALLQKGAEARVPELRQYAADGSLAGTSLMRQLEADPDHTVAQFAQAIGAIHYGCLGILQSAQANGGAGNAL